MPEPRVTITLGRAGQVVQRGGGRERFTGSDGFLSANKRQRVHGFKWRRGGDRFDGFEMSEDSGIASKDLRLKLMRKRHAEAQRKRILCEKLSKPIQPQSSANMLRQEPRQQNGHILLRQYPSKEILSDMSQEDLLRKYYSSQTMNGMRIRSPNRVWTDSRELSLRSFNDPQQVPATRVDAVSRAGQLLSKEVVDASRQAGLTTLKASTETMVVEPHSVASLLHSLGLRKYAITFQAEEVDMTALKQMSDKDLKELGIPMGPRKKILLAVQPLPKQQPPEL